MGRNIGFETEHIIGTEQSENFEINQEQAWNRVRKSIDNGLPCYGYPFHYIPELYIIYGYDECGYYYKGVDCESGMGPKYWKNFGKLDNNYFKVQINF